MAPSLSRFMDRFDLLQPYHHLLEVPTNALENRQGEMLGRVREFEAARATDTSGANGTKSSANGGK